jgi:hypothetical protein
VRANRRFLARAVRFLAAEAGVQQFLDIGTGIPAANNTHEVAQAVRPEARVTYVDNDPVVLAHARALLTSATDATVFIDADLRDVGAILSRAGETLAFSQPAAVMLIAVLHLIPDEDDVRRIVASFMDAVPSGRLPGAVPPGPRRGGRPVRQGGRPLQPARSGPDAPAYPGRGGPVPGRPGNRRTGAGANAPVAAGSQRSRGPVLRLRGRRTETLTR